MIETVIALLMIVDHEIKEHRIQPNMSECLRGKEVANELHHPLLSIDVLYPKLKQKFIWVKNLLRNLY